MTRNIKGVELVSFHPRKQHNFEQAAALAELFPGKFKHVTSVYFAPWLVKLLNKVSPKYAGQIGKRSYASLPKKYVLTMPSSELKRVLIGKSDELTPFDFLDLNEYWQKKVIRHFTPPRICISYDGISNLLFREWKNKAKLVLDLAIGLPQYRVKVLHGDSFHKGMLDDVDEYQRILFTWYEEEVQLADIILCGSDFVKKTVVYFFPEFENKCKILPYGTDLEAFSYPERTFQFKENLKYVFVGRLSWRKGAHLLLDAWKTFVQDHPKAELHFYGTPDKEISMDNLPDNVTCHGWIRKSDLIAELKTMDVFVFPTTFEGSSIAVFQAMALKLPVITTINSGTVLTNSDSCEIVEAGDNAGLIYAMDKLFHDPEYRKRLAEKAYLLSKGYTWNDYKLRLAKILEEIK